MGWEDISWVVVSPQSGTVVIWGLSECFTTIARYSNNTENNNTAANDNLPSGFGQLLAGKPENSPGPTSFLQVSCSFPGFIVSPSQALSDGGANKNLSAPPEGANKQSLPSLGPVLGKVKPILEMPRFRKRQLLEVLPIFLCESILYRSTKV